MRDQRPMGGTSFVLVVLGFWYGFTRRPNADAATGKPDAAKASVDPYEEQISEMSLNIFRGLENRLAFEAWADERNQ